MAEVGRGKLLIYWLTGREEQGGRRERTYTSNTNPIAHFLKLSQSIT